MSKKIFEDNAPIEFLDRNDMCQELQKYTYWFFDKGNKEERRLGTYVDDIAWDEDVAGITLNWGRNGKPTILMNPFFAEKLLDRAAETHIGDWFYDEDSDEYPEDYYMYFRYALLWAAYLALVIKTSPISDSNADAYISSWKKNIQLVYSELVQSFPEYKKAQEEFKTILREFTEARI